MDREHGDVWNFRGFPPPEQNWFRLPNDFVNIVAKLNQRRDSATITILLYVLRHTWGYQEYGIGKHITLDEFENGRVYADGTRIDLGTGLSKPTIIKAIRTAVEIGLLTVDVDESDRGRVRKEYRLRMLGWSCPVSVALPRFV